MTDSPSLFERINRVKAEVGRIPKSGRNAHFGYSFVTESDISDHLRPLMAKHGVAVVCLGPDPERFEVEEAGTTRSNQARFRWRVWMRYLVVNVENTEDHVEAWAIGEAIDQEDKGHNKAMTAARKYFLINLFDLSSGEDADNEAPSSDGDVKAAPKAKPPAGMGMQFAKLLQETLDKKGIAMKDLRKKLKEDDKCAAMLRGKMTSPEMWPEELKEPIRNAIRALEGEAKQEAAADTPLSVLGEDEYGRLIGAIIEAIEAGTATVKNPNAEVLAEMMTLNTDDYPGVTPKERVDKMIEALGRGEVMWDSGALIPF